VDKKKKRLSDHDLFLHFGNGAHLNIGVIPKSGEIIVDLDGDTLDHVLRFLSSNPELVHQVRGWYSGVAIKMGRRQGATREHI
jgi:hypothetical protein